VVASAPLPPDVSEVPTPALLVALVRWRNAQATLDTIYQWSGIHLSASDLAGTAYDKALAETLAYDAPIDAAVAIDAQRTDRDMTPHVAVSFGVRSLEAARRAAQALGTVTDGRPGEYRIRVKPSTRHPERAFCVLTAAAGAAPARFVCGRRERDVDALAPYMARTLPRRDLGAADVHVELHVPPALEAYGPSLDQGLHMGAAYLPRKLQIGEPVFDRAIERAAAGVSEELGVAMKDLDELALDVSLAPERAAVDVRLKMRSQQSWTAGTLASAASRAAPPPAIFWRLPQSATAAGYQYGADPARFIEIRHTLGELVDGWLLHEGLAAPDRAPIVATLSDKFAFDAPWVSASGGFTDASKPGSAPAARPGEASVRESWQEGWYISGFAGAAPIGEMLKGLVGGLNRPKTQALLKSSFARLADATPADGKPTTKASGALPLTVRAVPAPKGLPAGSLDFEITITPALAQRAAGGPTSSGAATSAPGAAITKTTTAPKPATVKMHVLVISQVHETWVGFASERDKLAATMLAVLENAKGSSTLTARTDLEPIRSGKFASASFSTLDGMLNSWRSPLMQLMGNRDAEKSLTEARAALDTAPHKGQTAILVTTSVDAGGPPHVHAHVDIPKGVIEDVIIAAASSLMLGLGRP